MVKFTCLKWNPIVRGPLGRRPPSFKHRGRRETAGEIKEETEEIQDDFNNNGSNKNSPKTSVRSKSSLEDKALSKVSWKKRVKQCVILWGKYIRSRWHYALSQWDNIPCVNNQIILATLWRQRHGPPLHQLHHSPLLSHLDLTHLCQHTPSGTHRISVQGIQAVLSTAHRALSDDSSIHLYLSTEQTVERAQ